MFQSSFKHIGMAGILVVAVFLIIAFTPALHAATITVPTNQPNIQAGINASFNGDTVLVSAGTYSGAGNRDLDFGSRSIVVRSLSGPSSTTIDCGGSAADLHIGFNFHSLEDSTSVLDGFTVINAHPPIIYDDGAIVCQGGASPTIRNCYVTLSSASGIRIRSEAYPQIFNCKVYYNGHDGIQIGSDSWPTAGGLVSGCLAAGNGHNGISIHALDSCRVENCTSIANERSGIEFVSELPIDGRAFGPPTDVLNSICAFNQGVGILRGVIFPSYSINNCNSFGNGAFDFVGADTFLTLPHGNFSADPLFCDTSSLNGFSLRPDSPCLPENNGSGTLIGAYGADCNSVCGDADGNGVIRISDVVYLINYIFAQGPAPMPVEIGDVDCSGSITISDVVYIVAYIFSSGPAPCAGC